MSDHCYPFSGHGRDEAVPAPPCMMHSRAMGRGKRQATAHCPNSYVHANDIYQVTPAYRLGSNVSLHLSEGQRQERAGSLTKGWSLTPEASSPPHPLTLQEKEIMKELMENGPVQGKCPSSCPMISEACACLRLGTVAQVVPTALSSKSTGARSGGLCPLLRGGTWRGHLEPWYQRLWDLGMYLQV